MQYQSFPNTKGSSKSLEKLQALRLPSMEGKRVLDVGCNEGFFCGYALFDGAREVIGIDRSRDSIEKAQIRFPQCSFFNKNWDDLPPGQFDIILFLSALHYASDQEKLIHQLMNRLNPDGLLVLELGIAPGGGNKWVKVQRSIDEREFPTRQKLSHILSQYAWKIIGYSVDQKGDPIQRLVVHIQKFKPYALLLLGNPGKGKTTFCRMLFDKTDIPIVYGDRIYGQIIRGTISASTERLQKFITRNQSINDYSLLTKIILENNLEQDLFETWCQQVDFQNFVIDSYLHEEHHEKLKNYLSTQGFIPINIDLPIKPTINSKQQTKIRSIEYQKYLNNFNFENNIDIVSITNKFNNEEFGHLIAWHLDRPTDQQILIENETVYISGWALSKNEKIGLSWKIANENFEEKFTPNKIRHDAAEYVTGKKNNIEKTNKCGINYKIEPDYLYIGFDIFIEYNGQYIHIAHIQTKKNIPNEGILSFFHKRFLS